MENIGKSWSNEDIKYLIENYSVKGSKHCSEFLKRKGKSVIAKARRIGLKSARNSFKYSKEYIEPIIKEAKSIKEVLEKMGLRAAGGNYQVINRYITKHGIDITHFETASERMSKNKKEKIPLENYLVENSNYTRTTLKKRLINEKLLEYKCYECGNDGNWMGKKLSLQLEHKNGVHNDNRLENLTLMCPNCHSQTNTFAGKANKKNKNIKIDKRTINTENKIKFNISRRKVERPKLEVLLTDIKELGYSGTGRKYGVSDNAIRKWLK
jgi:hypothetical protein